MMNRATKTSWSISLLASKEWKISWRIYRRTVGHFRKALFKLDMFEGMYADVVFYLISIPIVPQNCHVAIPPGKLRPIVDDNEADVALWNKEIAKYFRGKDFMNAPWLFAEAYKYRRLHECFSISKYWKDYDVFFRQKVRQTIPDIECRCEQGVLISWLSFRIVLVRYNSATPSHAPVQLSLSFPPALVISSSMKKEQTKKRKIQHESYSS